MVLASFCHISHTIGRFNKQFMMDLYDTNEIQSNKSKQKHISKRDSVRLNMLHCTFSFTFPITENYLNTIENDKVIINSTRIHITNVHDILQHVGCEC
jgi:hypothetical protein